MTAEAPSLSHLRRELILLGIARGMIFWYAIEKLFEIHIGLSAQQIVLVGMLAQGSKVVFELPTSVFADRWNRRNILIIAQLAMITCCLIAGSSHGIAIYSIGVLFWSLSDALSSGVYEAFAYDSIKAAGHERRFKRVYTRMKSSELISMALAGIVAGLLGVIFNVRLSFYLSIIPSVVSIVLLVRMKEPHFERTADNALNWIGHLGSAFRTLLSTRIRWAAGMYVVFIGLLSIWYEYYQLVGIDIHLRALLFGSLISVLTIGMMVGSELAHRFASNRSTIACVWLGLLATHLVGLRFHNATLAFINLFLTFIALMMLELYLELYLQENIPSERRATIMSLATTLGYAGFFVLATVFALVLKSVGIRWALTIASLPLLVLGIIDLLRNIPWAIGKTTDSSLPEELVEP